MAEPVDVPACFGALPWFAGGPSSARALARAAAEGRGADLRDLRTAVAAAELLMWPFVLEHGAFLCKLHDTPVASGTITCRAQGCPTCSCGPCVLKHSVLICKLHKVPVACGKSICRV